MVFATKYWVDDQYFRVSGPELHYSDTDSRTFFGEQFSLGGGAFLVWEGTSSDLGARPQCPPWRGACRNPLGQIQVLTKTNSLSLSLR